MQTHSSVEPRVEPFVESFTDPSPSGPSLEQPFDRNAFVFGFTPQAELWNGRLAMLGFVICLVWNILV